MAGNWRPSEYNYPDRRSTSVRTAYRNAIEDTFNEARLRGQLEFRTETKGTEDQLYLYSTLSLPYTDDDAVSITGSALQSENGRITLTENSDNVIRRQNSFGAEFYPYGLTWKPTEVGEYSIYAVALDAQTGSQSVSESRVIYVETGSGEDGIPTVTLDPVAENIDFTNGATSVFLGATAFDDDGKILEVSFYGNGELLESDSTSPYSSSLDFRKSTGLI